MVFRKIPPTDIWVDWINDGTDTKPHVGWNHYRLDDANDDVLLNNKEVIDMLCDGCKLGLSHSAIVCGQDDFDLDKRYSHYINGVTVPCFASRFRVMISRKRLIDDVARKVYETNSI